ncbi:unnamed protein product [Oppiella nova]|uniref:Nose resistant-to-fluoxetine protein N-terminal domain-containing protein n=1 Tax=Oppiella nova TaxID=334625 RepID=A0A7R9LXA4_9ACAR|nr:unnamed protein product [Oppiella nova]CAG2167837.1 unnamed protein product [Oppiella nova]
MTAMARIGQAVRAQEQWAMKFMDSSPIGKVEVSSLPFGEYDECIEIESTYQWDQPTITGQYCALGIPTPMIPASDAHTPEDNKRNDDMLLNYLKQRLNSSEENSLEKRLNNETDGHFVEGLLRYIEYLGHDNIRLPPGICLPNVCSAKDAEWAINKKKPTPDGKPLSPDFFVYLEKANT